MKKYILIILVSLFPLFANEDIQLNSDYLKNQIEEDFKNCIKDNNFMDCDEQRMINKGKAEIFEMNYKASEELIKHKKEKEKILEQKYIPSKEEIEIDNTYDKCYKKAKSIEEHKKCLSEKLNKNTKD